MSNKYYKILAVLFFTFLFCFNPSKFIYPQMNISMSKDVNYNLNEILYKNGKINKIINGSFNTEGYKIKIDPITSEPVFAKISKNDSIPKPRWSSCALNINEGVYSIANYGNQKLFVGRLFTLITDLDNSVVPNSNHIEVYDPE
ncbi:MAG: hypothetical protein IIC75_06730 [Bacteroidetes bacterium]|nr:hypothetical protein [Bacteroidota bacterium]